jgi:hypothetical protein
MSEAKTGGKLTVRQMFRLEEVMGTLLTMPLELCESVVTYAFLDAHVTTVSWVRHNRMCMWTTAPHASEAPRVVVPPRSQATWDLMGVHRIVKLPVPIPLRPPPPRPPAGGPAMMAATAAAAAASSTTAFVAFLEDSSRLVKLNADGELIGQTAGPALPVKAVSALAADEQGRVFVADRAGRRVAVTDVLDGWHDLQTFAPFSHPNSLAYDQPSGRLFVLDGNAIHSIALRERGAKVTTLCRRPASGWRAIAAESYVDVDETGAWQRTRLWIAVAEPDAALGNSRDNEDVVSSITAAAAAADRKSAAPASPPSLSTSVLQSLSVSGLPPPPGSAGDPNTYHSVQVVECDGEPEGRAAVRVVAGTGVAVATDGDADRACFNAPGCCLWQIGRVCGRCSRPED